jgi:hypothetical protein
MILFFRIALIQNIENVVRDDLPGFVTTPVLESTSTPRKGWVTTELIFVIK